MGCINGKAELIKQNEWFKGVIWEQVATKKIAPPWIPELMSKQDFQYFDQYNEDGQIMNEVDSDEQI